MRSTRLSEDVKCPSCGEIIDGATCPFHDATPNPGDLSVCVYCLHWLRFNNDLTLRSMDQDDINKLKPIEFQQLMELTKSLLESRK